MQKSFLLLLIFTKVVFSQGSFQQSGDCQRTKNVNCASAQTSYLNKDNIRSVFKFNYLKDDGGRYMCTGTMINQYYDAGGILKQYFITADHCFQDYSLNYDFEFFFNYQSSNCDDSTVPDRDSARIGNRYSFASRVRKIASNSWVDGALFEIITPIPPHFNVYYSGFDPTINPLFIGLPKYVIHHPKGDIKKIAYTPAVIEIFQNQVCHFILTIVDAVLNFFFGWLIEFRIQTICTYLENPRLIVPAFTSGITEKGSSGSALFSTGNKISAILNGGFGTCNVPVAENFGRLHSFWNASGSLRTALDRRKKTYLENAFGFVTGIDGRQPNCYSGDPLVLNGNYFPANEYQPENKITINAKGSVLLASGSGHNGGNLVALAGSDFVINATEFNIGSGIFDIDPAATFELAHQPCDNSNIRMEIQDDISNHYP